jgi:hypothetical protein
MVLEGKLHVNEMRGDLIDFAQKAPVEELLATVKQTGLANHQQVRCYNDQNVPAFYHKEQELRRLVYKTMKNHADFSFRMAWLLSAKKPADEKKQPKEANKGKKQEPAGS